MFRSLPKPVVALILVGLLLVAEGISSARQPALPPRQDRCRDGTYTLVIRGYYTGQGTAEVRETTIRIDAEVRTPDGQVGRLNGTFPASGPYFGGRGRVMRDPNAMVYGRVDAAKASRLAATFQDSSGHAARVVATLPSDPGDETWDDVSE